MVNILSPDVYVIERDISEYAPTVNSSVVGLVGFASKGPMNKATLVTSPQNLTRVFGRPSEHISGQALEGAIEILETTNQVYFVRAGDSTTATDASSTVTYGGCPAVGFVASALGVTNGLYLKVDVSSNDGVNQYSTVKSFAIPAGTGTGGQAQALRSIIGGSLDSDKVGVEFDTTTSTTGFLVGSWAGSGTAMTVSAYADSAYTHPASALSVLNRNGEVSGIAHLAVQGYASVTVFGSEIDTSGFSYVAQTIHPGAGYNAGTKANGDTSGNSVELDAKGGANSVLAVNEDGTKAEEFKVSLISNADFIEDKINVGETNTTSDIIKGQLYFSGAPGDPTALTNYTDNISNIGTLEIFGGSKNPIGYLHDGDSWQDQTNAGGVSGAYDINMNPRFVKPLEGTTNMTGGANGDSANQTTSLIGDSSVTPKTGMQALDDDSINISMAAVPGQHDQTVQNALITLAESTQEFLAVVSPPYAVGTVQNAIDWSNGRSDTRTAAINSSWAAVYWPHTKVFSSSDKKDIWLDPAVYGIRAMALTDNISETWFAPAGANRGRLTKPTEVEVILNKGDRDSLYTGGNVINPIAKFPQRGIMIFGQRTAQRKPTSLDRINVRRLMIFVMKTVRLATRDLIFEPNDEFTWALIQGVLEPLMDDIKRRRGIIDFRVVCDDTVNTPARVDRNELWTKVIIKPTKTAEALVFEINLTSQSADLGNL
tara:strand:+ start:1255 stop:3390 length:2136 start_codon:yes stop_codon:yes gene_type:complete